MHKFLMAIVVMAGTACTGASDVSNAIGTLARDGKQPVFRLDQATPFAWDHVVFFTPYLPRANVCTALNLARHDCRRLITFESEDDTEMTLAFIRQGVLVRYVMHTRDNGDFLPMASATVMTPDDAVFRSIYTGSRVRKLVLAASSDGHRAGPRAQPPGAPVNQP
jgi:hypothetical protein